MKLLEVLNSSEHWEWTSRDDDRWIAEFDLDQQTIAVMFDKQHNPYAAVMDEAIDEVVIIGFTSRKLGAHRAEGTTKITGTGQEFKVFATVVDIIQNYVVKHKTEAMLFGADEDEPSRVKLYKRFVKKLVTAGWRIAYSSHGSNLGSTLDWLLVKK